MRSLALLREYLPDVYDGMLSRYGLKVVFLGLFKRSDFERRKNSQDSASFTKESLIPSVVACAGAEKEQSGNRWL